MMVNAILTTFAFAGVLWSIAPPLLLMAIVYAAIGSVLTVALGHRLVSLNNLQLKKEGDLRHGLIHLQEHVELAAAPGERDRLQVHALLRRAIRNSRAIITVTRDLGFFTSGYNYLVPIIPILIVAPRYLHRQIEFEMVTQSAMAFAQLLGGFSLIVGQFQSLSAFTAVVRRLGSFWEEMETAAALVRDPLVRLGAALEGCRSARDPFPPREGHLAIPSPRLRGRGE
jgi:putative ATP-binding cassette transporter